MYDLIDWLLSLDNNNVVKDYVIVWDDDLPKTVKFFCEENGQKFRKEIEIELD